jgi:NodT family efflux transporter outer membrane factor (OMF) lipoprotein
VTQKSKFQYIASLSLITVLLSSCSLIPNYNKPQVQTPARWTEAAKDAQGQEIPSAWWTVFGDETLNQLVTEANKNNLDLIAGIERVNQSRASLKIAGASLLPSAEASLSAGKNRTNPVKGSTTTTTPLSGSLSISYDLDLFGSNRASNEQARATLKSTEYTQKSLELTTAGDVAEAYFNLLMTRERIRIGQDNLKNSNELLRIVEARVNAGVDSNLELSQQHVAVSNSEAALAALTQTEVVYKNALAILLGQAPQDFTLTDGSLDKILIPAIASGQPSTLLERRPDIASVEQQLIAANANIGVARAAYFPSITLGLTATATGAGFSNPIGTALGIASSLTAPIFEGGRLEDGVELANAKQKELIANYRKTVLTSYGEVENALSSVETSSARETALKTAVSEAQKAYEISRKRYQVGTIDFATMLDTQANLLSAQDNYAQAMKARLSASLDLVKALGGGWKSSDKPAEIPAVAPAVVAPVVTPAVKS